MDEEDNPEPCPATFDQMVALLAVWPKGSTLDAWALTQAPTSSKWDGRRRVVQGNAKPHIPQEWEEMRQRLKELVE